ncbi:MAG: bifunctional 2-C-methyl-D-erythritol 4-phosphate cytidylyltransferase/2-C-methyl-D-erythritol 2,4-cyclodiphosphate synthase, partial [Alphaproteobacteria bacterium]|nr:bifunctional 2-C-methyl-D-erythritol 4-phosphate cytidylyltransferase/2-C-methyl-D-erythritol 2,4-cyclodiphosphate synthase [Alphaproteobacteria bacterium]
MVRGVNPAALVIACPPAHLDVAREIADDVGIAATVVAGGETRTDSVRRAMDAMPAVDVVLIHDVARSGAPIEVFDRVIATVVKTNDAAVPVLPVHDTIVVADDGVVTENTERARLFRVQTPQGFPGLGYAAAIAETIGDFTDDASIWRGTGGTVRTVAGDERSHKITVEADLASYDGSIRVGLGTDTHAFGDSGPLWLGCLEWPDE